jgi:hypothetical protein
VPKVVEGTFSALFIIERRCDKMKTKKAVFSLMFVCASLALLMIIGCDGSDDAGQSATVVQASLPIGFFLTTSPGEPVAVQQLKTEAQPGDEAIVRVVVGGEKNVFVADRAIVKVIDASVKNPCLAPGDSCPTPWDYCCTLAEELQPHRATVKVTDAQDKTLRLGLKGQGEIAVLKTLVVKGIVAAGSDDKNLIINALCIFRED